MKDKVREREREKEEKEKILLVRINNCFPIRHSIFFRLNGITLGRRFLRIFYWMILQKYAF